MISDKRDYRIHAELSRFLGEPFETVDVLGRAHGHGQAIRNGAEPGDFFENLRLGPSGIGDSKTAFEKRPKPVDHRDLVPDSVAQHSDAVSGFFRVQPRRNAGYIMRIEKFHTYALFEQ